MSTRLAVLLLTLGAAAPAHAQVDSVQAARIRLLQRLQPGATLRLTAHSGQRVGVLRRVSGDSVYVDSFALRLTEVDRIELRERATRSGLKWGAVGGTIGGAAFGGFLGLLFYGLCESDCPDNAAGPVVLGTLGGAVSGLIGGGALGAVIGSALPRWVDIEKARPRAATRTRGQIGVLTFTPLLGHAQNGAGVGGGARAAFMFQGRHIALGPELAWQNVGRRERVFFAPCLAGQTCIDTLAFQEHVTQAGGVLRVGTGSDRQIEPYATIGAGFHSWRHADLGSIELAGYSLGSGLEYRSKSGKRGIFAEARWQSNLSRSGDTRPDYGYYTFGLGGAVSW